MGHVLFMVMVGAQDARLSQVNTFRASAHAVFAIVSLAKASHMTKDEAHRARKSTLPTLLGVPAKSHSKGCGDIMLISGQSKEWVQ